MISINLKKRIFTSLALFTLFFLLIKYQFIFAYTLIVFGILAIIEFSIILKKIIKNKINTLILNLAFILYVFFTFLMFFIFSNIFHLKILIFVILFGCVASDIGGYIFGKIFKGPKLTKISPNKTIAGAIGSLILSFFIMFLILNYLNVFKSWKILILSLVISLSCQIGDLLISYLKRKAKIKDTGNFLPGHGGILDRIDGIILGVPIGFITFLIIY